MMKELRALLAWIRVVQCNRAVLAYEHDIHRARDGLARALRSQDAALGAMRALDNPPATVPAFLKVAK